jgi:hypothetical protein
LTRKIEEMLGRMKGIEGMDLSYELKTADEKVGFWELVGLI